MTNTNDTTGAGSAGFPLDLEELLASPSNRTAGPSLLEVWTACRQLEAELGRPSVQAAILSPELPGAVRLRKALEAEVPEGEFYLDPTAGPVALEQLEGGRS